MLWLRVFCWIRVKAFWALAGWSLKGWARLCWIFGKSCSSVPTCSFAYFASLLSRWVITYKNAFRSVLAINSTWIFCNTVERGNLIQFFWFLAYNSLPKIILMANVIRYLCSRKSFILFYSSKLFLSSLVSLFFRFSVTVLSFVKRDNLSFDMAASRRA